jgi:hypothetical protein
VNTVTLHGYTITCPLELAGVDAWSRNSEQLAVRGASDHARRCGDRPDPAPAWVGWTLDVWTYDAEGHTHPDLFRSRSLDGRPQLVDVPKLAADEDAVFLVSAEVGGVPDPAQRLANALLALAWQRATSVYGSVAR